MCLGGSILSIVEFFYILLTNVLKKPKRKKVFTIYFNEMVKDKKVSSKGLNVVSSKSKKAIKFKTVQKNMMRK